MKKLLVLILVLGLASAANATLSLSVNGGDPGAETAIGPSDSIILDISSDNTTAYGAWLYVYDGPRTLSNPRVIQGDTSSIFSVNYANYNYYYVTIASSTGNLVPGTGFELDYQATGIGDVTVELYNQDASVLLDTLTIHQAAVPEPMTIALLGLGGLFLRRRK